MMTLASAVVSGTGEHRLSLAHSTDMTNDWLGRKACFHAVQLSTQTALVALCSSKEVSQQRQSV